MRLRRRRWRFGLLRLADPPGQQVLGGRIYNRAVPLRPPPRSQPAPQPGHRVGQSSNCCEPSGRVAVGHVTAAVSRLAERP